MATGTSASNVAVGKPNLAVCGGVLYGKVGAPAITDATTQIPEDYVSAGYVSDEGVSETSDRSTEEIHVWGGRKVRTVQTEYGVTLSFGLIESVNADVLKFVFGDDNVVADGKNITVKRNEKVLPHISLVVDMLDGDNARRLYAANAQITEVDEITYADGEAITYTVTVSCDPDDNGDSLSEFIQVGGGISDGGDGNGEGEGSDDSGE
jgi:hypothetical protein